MVAEQKAETFSPEEAPNVMITCALSATAFDLLPNFKAILTGGSQKQQHKIKLFEVFGEVARYAPSFLLTGDRLSSLLQPQIELAT